MKCSWLCSLVLALSSVAMAPTATHADVPKVGHVFVIVLENKDYDVTFGPNSPAPYLARTLPAQGQLLTQYHGIGHLSLDNYIAMVSGQAPNPITQSDCQVFQDFVLLGVGADGQALGAGCVYPASVKTVANQLEDQGLTWHGYMQDMKTPCQHPDLNAQDHTQSATADSQYAARHNPFVYFHAIIDTPSCAANDVPLDRLNVDLRSITTTPNYSFITPDLCHDGHDATCADGGKGGLGAVNDFLQEWVPKIQASPAYRDGGLIVVTFDESESGAESCCVHDTPNTPNAGGIQAVGTGGGRVGAVLLSPYIAPGSRNDHPYNHYSLLRSIEDDFGLLPLGYAGRSTPFGEDVFNGPRCFSHPIPEGSGPTLTPGTLIDKAWIVRDARGVLLSVRMAHAAGLVIKTRDVRGRSHRVGPGHGHACTTYRVRISRRSRSVSVKAAIRGHREVRIVRVPR